MKNSAKKNLTLSLPAGLIRSAKILAAQRGTSVNALVRESLERMISVRDEYDAALRRILETAKKGLYRSSGKFSRSELYD